MNCKVCLDKIKKAGKYPSYHDECFREVFNTIKIEAELPFTKQDFKTEKARRNNKRFSISGVQPKLLISIQEESLEVTETGGTHIIKISPDLYESAAENEHLTMEIIRSFGIETAACGLMPLKDGELAYITKRFDRLKDGKIHQEDMMQSMGIQNDEDSKYDSKTYEDVAHFLNANGSLIVVYEFFKRVVLNYLLGNDDFHLKNISIRENRDIAGQIKLTPLYDSLNTMVYTKESGARDMALYLMNGSDDSDGYSEHYNKYGFYTKLCFDEFAEKIGLNTKLVHKFYNEYKARFASIKQMVSQSYLPDHLKKNYLYSLEGRYEKFFKPEK